MDFFFPHRFPKRECSLNFSLFFFENVLFRIVLSVRSCQVSFQHKRHDSRKSFDLTNARDNLDGKFLARINFIYGSWLHLKVSILYHQLRSIGISTTYRYVYMTCPNMCLRKIPALRKYFRCMLHAMYIMLKKLVLEVLGRSSLYILKIKQKLHIWLKTDIWLEKF